MRIGAPMSTFLAFVITGCSVEQLVLVNSAANNARAGAAASITTSTTIAQTALLHITAALSQLVRGELKESSIVPFAEASQDESAIQYEVDGRTGRGKILRSQKDRILTDLTFSFKRESGNAGVSYAITGTSGHFEGFQFQVSRMTVMFTAVLGEQLHPTKHANGSQLVSIRVQAVGALGINGVETLKIDRANINMVYPISEGESQIGEISTIAKDGNTFDGAMFVTDRILSFKGEVKSPSGVNIYSVNSDASGGVSLTESPNSTTL